MPLLRPSAEDELSRRGTEWLELGEVEGDDALDEEGELPPVTAPTSFLAK